MKTRLLRLSLLFFILTIMVANTNAGPIVDDFLLSAPDARGVATAGAVQSLPGNLYASYWNPAGLYMLEGINVSVSFPFLPNSKNHINGTFAYELESVGVVGGYINTLEINNITYYDNGLSFSGPYINLFETGALYYGIGIGLPVIKTDQARMSYSLLDIGHI